RDDIGSAAGERFIIASKQAVPPCAEARDDFAICAELAERLGVGERFTEERSVREWLAHLYDQSRGRATAVGVELPPFEEFWEAGIFELPAPEGSRCCCASSAPTPMPRHCP